MKTLLINPPFKRKIGNAKSMASILPPMGLSYLAAVLRKAKFEVEILDVNALNLAQKEILDYVKKSSPDIIGFGAVTPTIMKAFEIAKLIRAKFPKIKIVFGGPHPTSLPLESIQKAYVDFVVFGEGEITFLELVQELSKTKGRKFSKIAGLIYKDKKVQINPPRGRLIELDDLPFPAIDLLPLQKYESKDSKCKKFIPLLTSRGCPWNCIYCNKLTFGNKFIMRSAENIVQEIEELQKKYGYQDFHILDDLFTCNRKRVVDFCNLVIEKKLNIVWKCANGVRVNTVDLELLKLMKKSGCYMLNYGVESGSQKILDRMKKGQTIEQIEEAVKATKKSGINCGCCFMFGNLGENRETMQHTLDFAKKLNPDIAMFSILIPYPGTVIEKQIKKEGKIFIKNWDDYDNFEGQAVFEHGELTTKDMKEMHHKSYKEFYLRPKYILSQIFKKRTFNEIKNRINSFIALIKI
jgi:radical SAM superfamily enzyme YgiQ (UPF0313 family)